MKEKILALLVAKFAGVRKDGLAQLALSLSLQAADDTEATALVEKITADKVNDFVKDWRKDVDKEVSEGVKTNEKNLKDKYDLVEKKNPDPNPDPNKKPDPTDVAAIIAAELAKVVTPLQAQIAALKGEKTTETRLQALTDRFKDKNLPETFTAKMAKDFARMNFETDEQFNEYLTEVDADVTAFTQELADKGMSGHTKPLMGGKDANGVSSGVASFIESKTKPEVSLGGKEV